MISDSFAARSSRACDSSARSSLPPPDSLAPDWAPRAASSLPLGGTISSRAPGAAVSVDAVAAVGRRAGVAAGAGSSATVSTGCGTGARREFHAVACSRTISAASASPSVTISSREGMRSTAPCLSRLMLSSMKASGFARCRATII